jgi:hypothetical protein
LLWGLNLSTCDWIANKTSCGTFSFFAIGFPFLVIVELSKSNALPTITLYVGALFIPCSFTSKTLS